MRPPTWAARSPAPPRPAPRSALGARIPRAPSPPQHRARDEPSAHKMCHASAGRALHVHPVVSIVDSSRRSTRVHPSSTPERMPQGRTLARHSASPVRLRSAPFAQLAGAAGGRSSHAPPSPLHAKWLFLPGITPVAGSLCGFSCLCAAPPACGGPPPREAASPISDSHGFLSVWSGSISDRRGFLSITPASSSSIGGIRSRVRGGRSGIRGLPLSIIRRRPARRCLLCSGSLCGGCPTLCADWGVLPRGRLSWHFMPFQQVRHGFDA
jgi:hypothetical protein